MNHRIPPAVQPGSAPAPDQSQEDQAKRFFTLLYSRPINGRRQSLEAEQLLVYYGDESNLRK
ncbi:MAG TPA: hypothetical protein VKR83_05970 [Ktedonobacteraceae bacterium]|nr:hypothetical protein [Ktedonobacteraceae bacterium]